MRGIVVIKTHLIVTTLSTVLAAMTYKTAQMKTFIETLMTATSNTNETNLTVNMMADMMTNMTTSRTTSRTIRRTAFEGGSANRS
jgi:hypothetical protein